MQYEFGAYQLDGEGRVLFREGVPVALSPKVAELLVALVHAAGTVLTREHLVDRLWPDTVVEEGSLTSHISLLRKTLGKNSNGQEFVETLSKRGYRFVAPITLAASETTESVLSRIMLVVLPFENFTTGDRSFFKSRQGRADLKRFDAIMKRRGGQPPGAGDEA